MDVIFDDDDLERIEAVLTFMGRFSEPIVNLFRRRMQYIRAASDERDFMQMRSFRFEKLKGKRKHQHSIRLNNQYRLIVEIVKNNPKNTIKIIGIEDYH